MLSGKAALKSISSEMHSLAVANLDTLFKSADSRTVHPDRDNNANIKAIHRFNSKISQSRGLTHKVKITVKELNNPKENRIYSVEVLKK